MNPRCPIPHEPNSPASCVTTVPAYPPLPTPTVGPALSPAINPTPRPFAPSPIPPAFRASPRHLLWLACSALSPPHAAEQHGASPRPPPRRGIVAALPRRCRCGNGWRELGQGGERPPKPGVRGAAAQAARHRSGEALRHGADGAPRARQQRHQGRGGAPERAGGRRGQAPVLRARLGAPQRGGLLPGDADPGRRRGERGVRHGRQRHVPARPRHDQRARGAGEAEHGQGREGVLPHRADGAGGQLPSLRGRVPGGALAGRDEAHAGLSVPDGVVPHGERVPVLRVRGQRGRDIPGLRAVPAQRRGARLRQRAQVLQPPGRAAGRRVQRGREAREQQLQRGARGGVGDRVALQGGREGGGRVGVQRGRLQREPGAARAVGERRHPAPCRRGRGRVPVRALQREPEARADLRAQLRRVLPEPAAGVRRGVRPRRQACRQGHRRRRPRVAGRRQERQCGAGSRRWGRGEGCRGARGRVVRGERDGGGRASEGGAGLRVRAGRRGLQGHPARRGVLRAQHDGVARVVRVQRLLPAQGPVHRHLRLRRRRLRREPGTKDGQVRAPLHGLKSEPHPASAIDKRAFCI